MVERDIERSLALNLNPANLINDVKAVMSEAAYDDVSAHTPLHKMGCSFHPQWRNQVDVVRGVKGRTPRCSSVAPPGRVR